MNRLPSELERAFATGIRLRGMPAPEYEYRFAPPRRWRFDAAYPEHMVAVELEGGIFSRGRHTRGTGGNDQVETGAKRSFIAKTTWFVLFRETVAIIVNSATSDEFDTLAGKERVP